jgi:hypothetical protein
MTATDTTTKPEEDAYSPEEDTNVDASLRRKLGLRPLYYHEVGKHADQRPCPPWCWVGQTHGEYDHEVDPHHPLTARHELKATPASAASLYQGVFELEDNVRHVRTASVEPRLQQIGQEQPTIRVALRRWEGRKQRFDEVLNLSIDDAREFMTVLGRLVEIAES